jgi:phenylalanyl-tRNA synthetase beta chain
MLDGVVIGHVGELHPRWRQAYDIPAFQGRAPVLFELDLPAVLARPVPEFSPLPRQQPVQRDLALVVGERVSHDSLVGALRADPAGLVQAATLFDVYIPAVAVAGMAAGERSLAVRLELLDREATLTEDRIEAVVAAAVARAAAACSARLRS